MTRRPIDAARWTRGIGLALAATAVLNVGFYLLFTRPGIRDAERLRDGSDPQRKELLARRAEVDKQEKFLQQIEKTETNLKQLRGDMLSTREQRMIGVELEVAELCERFGIEWEAVRIQNEILTGEELDRMVITVPLEGGYANLRKFLQAVETSSSFLVVEQVALAQATDGGVMLQLNVTLATYFDAPEVRERNRVERAKRPAGRRT